MEGKNIFHIDFMKIKKAVKFIDKMLKSKLDSVESKAYCLGYVMAMATYTDVNTEAISDLNTYIKARSKI